MAKKKFRIVTGMCGPTVLTTGIIKAEDKRDAVVQYLSGRGNDEISESEILSYLEHTYEIQPKPKKKSDKCLTDVNGKTINAGDNVAFIANVNLHSRLYVGSVSKLGNTTVNVESKDGNKYRVSCDDDFCVKKIVIVGRQPAREGNLLDVNGYPIEVGDKVYYCQTGRYQSDCCIFCGTVTKATDRTVLIDETERRNCGSVLVCNV